MAILDSAQWRDILTALRVRHPAMCRHWFEELEPADFSGGVLTVGVANPVHKNYLQRKCLDAFTEAAQEVTGRLVGVRFVNAEEAPRDWGRASENRPRAAASDGGDHSLSRGRNGGTATLPAAPASPGDDGDSVFDDELDQLQINPDYTFDTFVTGPTNRLAFAASVAVANQPGEAYNPLFIHGGVGLGKTHLLQGICNTIIQANPQARICYLSCDTFVNHFLDCVQNGTMKQFRHRYRHVDVLVIDDIHFLANRERTQEEFFHTFNELYQTQKQIVLSSDSPPNEIPQLEERLVSRFQWGLVANVTKPDFETRVAIIRAKLKVRSIEMSDEVVNYVATKLESNARELEGALTTIQAAASLGGRTIDLGLAHEVLGDPPPEARSSQVTLQHIIEEVTRYYNVKLSELQSKRRHKSITEPRQVCMWLARRRTRFSLQEIGAYFGGRDHTTVMHSIKTVEDRVGQDRRFAQQVTHLDHRVEQLV